MSGRSSITRASRWGRMPRAARESRRIAMTHYRALAARRFQNRKPLALKALGGVARALVPGLARIVLLEAGAGVDDQERGHPRRMGAIKGKRHVAAKRKSADDGAFRADLIQQRRHVADRQGLAIGVGIQRIVGLAVA